MGRLTIGRDVIKLDDRVLAHLEAVIVTKLRRQEPFVFTWPIDVSLGSGRVAKWVSASTSWDIRFDNRQSEPLNQAWLKQLMSTANSPGGLKLVPEPSQDQIPSTADSELSMSVEQ